MSLRLRRAPAVASARWAGASIGGGLAGVLAGAAGGLILTAAAVTAAACGLAALALTLAGSPLVGGTIHAIAQASPGAQATLTPLGRLIGEPDFDPVTAAVVGTGEGALFGLGLTLGLTRRP